MSEKKPIKTLQLTRETVKRLGVRTGMQTGMAVSVDTTLGVAGSGVKGPPKNTDGLCVGLPSGGIVIDPAPGG